MCGIWGSTNRLEKEIIEEKISSIAFRGPDFSDVKYFDKVVLGSTRLAIVNQEIHSNMPFEKEGYVIVFNGEIYNYNELKKSYLSNQSFITDSDTEVLVELYRKLGTSFLNLLNGMFAFTLYDSHKQILFGARDRTGKKPFFYFHDKNHFEFASQPKAILIGNQHIKINPDAEMQYFAWKHIPEPICIFQGIHKLEPGAFFIYKLTSHKLSIEKYWDFLPQNANKHQHLIYNESKLELKESLIDAIKLRIPSNQDYGLSLSGGVDSSLIASLISTFESNLHTYSVGFKNNLDDESVYASEVSNILGTKHTNFYCESKDVLRIIQELPKFYDEPFADSSAIVTSFLFENTSKYNRIMLTGDGSDELFFGYLRYTSTLNEGLELLKKSNISIKDFPTKIRRYLLNKNKNTDKKPKYKSIEELYLSRLLSSESDFLLETFYIEIAKKIVTKRDTLFDNSPLFNKMMRFDFKNYLINDILVKVDRASMFNKTEARSPFLDPRIVNFAQSLPLDYLYDGKQQKIILKDILKTYLPENIINRKKKGFSLPLSDFFRSDLKEYIIDIITEKNLNKIEIINTKRAIEIRDLHLSSEKDYSGALYAILVYINWSSCYSN